MSDQNYRKPKYNNMTVKTRLNISNLLMIVIPLFIAGLTSLMSFLFAYLWIKETQKISTLDNEEILQVCQEITDSFIEAFEFPRGSEKEESFLLLEEHLSDNNIRVRVIKSEEEVYSYGSEKGVDKNLMNAAEEIGENGYIASGNRQLYIRSFLVANEKYQISIFIDKAVNPYRGFRILIIIAAVVFVFVMVIAVYFTNKFLTQFVYYRIQGPLNILADGVHEIQEGNLDYQIEYEANDEFLPVVQDFNEMSNALKQTTKELIRQEENRKSLLASISHDLRSPLTAINGYADGLLDGIASTEETKNHYLLQIKERSSEMIRMVTRLFMFSKMDLDEYPIYPVSLRLDKEIEELIYAVSSEYMEKGIHIVMREMTEAHVFADPDQIHTIMTNLLDNASKYMDKEEGFVFISIKENESDYILSIEDNGPGVSEESLPKLFEVFYRSDPSRKNVHKGSGLGLAIVKKAVNRMHGKVDAKNSETGGLMISICLPKDRQDAENSNH